MSKYFGFVYITTNKINDKKYIGLHTNFNDDYLGSGKVFSKALKKYGKENFERKIIYLAKDREELNLAEDLFIRSRNAIKSDLYYNLISGGGAPTIEGKAKKSESMKGKDNPFYGKTHTKEFKDEQRNRKTGTKLTEDVKIKMSESHKGKRSGEDNNATKAVLILNSNNEIIWRFGNTIDLLYGSWRKIFTRPNGRAKVYNCLKTGELFHGYKLIYEKDYTVVYN